MKGTEKATADLPAYAETDYPIVHSAGARLRSLRTGKFLFVHAPKRELYDQSQDKSRCAQPGGNFARGSRTLQAQIDDFHDKTTSFQREDICCTAHFSRQSENLSALGYVSSSAAGASQDPFQGADPKDKIGISNILAGWHDRHRRRPL